jgi:hypothetical protein
MTDLTLLPIEVQRLRHQALLELKAADKAEATARTIALSPASPEACLRVLLFQLAWERRRVARAALLDALHKLEMAALQDPKAERAFRVGARSILSHLDAIAAVSAPVRASIVESEQAILH